MIQPVLVAFAPRREFAVDRSNDCTPAARSNNSRRGNILEERPVTLPQPAARVQLGGQSRPEVCVLALDQLDGAIPDAQVTA